MVERRRRYRDVAALLGRSGTAGAPKFAPFASPPPVSSGVSEIDGQTTIPGSMATISGYVIGRRRIPGPGQNLFARWKNLQRALLPESPTWSEELHRHVVDRQGAAVPECGGEVTCLVPASDVACLKRLVGGLPTCLPSLLNP